MRETTVSEAWSRKVPSSVCCAVACDEKGRATIIPLGWMMPTSGKPPMLAISVGHTRYSHHCIRTTKEFVVALPNKDQGDAVLYCGTHSGRDTDKFAGSGLRPLRARVVGAPLIAEAVTNFECRLVGELDTGDHTIFVGEIVAAHVDDEHTDRLYNLGGRVFSALAPVGRKSGNLPTGYTGEDAGATGGPADPEPGITPNDAHRLFDRHVRSENLRKHSLAAAAIMHDLAEELGANPAAWGLLGLLHDLDFDDVKEPERHGLLSAELLERAGASGEFIEAVKSHNAEGLGLERKSPVQHALTAAESITGLIVAAALVQPDKRLAAVRPESVLKRMKKKDFARNVSRERIAECEKLSIPLPRFVELSLVAMQRIADELGL